MADAFVLKVLLALLEDLAVLMPVLKIQILTKDLLDLAAFVNLKMLFNHWIIIHVWVNVQLIPASAENFTAAIVWVRHLILL